MGLFKQMKDMKTVVAAAPGMIEQAQQLQANAAQMQSAQFAAAQGAAPTAAATGSAGAPDPIAGVSLEEYARLSKTIGEQRLDEQGIEQLMSRRGYAPGTWQAAYDGWNARFKGNTALAVQFGNLYQSVQAY
jgi:hypothetical protein